jgi:hypothetical protein
MSTTAGIMVSLALAAGWSVDAETDQKPVAPGRDARGAEEVEKVGAPSSRALAGKVARVTASSVLVERGRAKDRYLPERAVDGNFKTCWCKGTKGHGEGEWLQLDLAAPAKVRAIRVYPGCGAEDRIYFANNRIAQLEVAAGDATATVKLTDERRLQDVAVPTSAPVPTLRFTIRGIQERSRKPPKFDDTCIGEIEADLE